jgi:hypothetical protein
VEYQHVFAYGVQSSSGCSKGGQLHSEARTCVCTHAHARTHARTHTRTHAHTHAHHALMHTGILQLHAECVHAPWHTTHRHILYIQKTTHTHTQSTLQYGHEHFLEQVNLAEQLTSSDFGISTGLINQNYWENSKWYYVNVERGNTADKLNGRNINVSFTNDSNVSIEVMYVYFILMKLLLMLKQVL